MYRSFLVLERVGVEVWRAEGVRNRDGCEKVVCAGYTLAVVARRNETESDGTEIDAE